MQRFSLMAFLLLLFACGPAGTPEAEQVMEATAEPAIPTTAPTVAAAALTTTLEEARVVRERDWRQGADDPAVTIIEYGDFQ